jgi:hypothetical protein
MQKHKKNKIDRDYESYISAPDCIDFSAIVVKENNSGPQKKRHQKDCKKENRGEKDTQRPLSMKAKQKKAIDAKDCKKKADVSKSKRKEKAKEKKNGRHGAPDKMKTKRAKCSSRSSDDHAFTFSLESLCSLPDTEDSSSSKSHQGIGNKGGASCSSSRSSASDTRFKLPSDDIQSGSAALEGDLNSHSDVESDGSWFGSEDGFMTYGDGDDGDGRKGGRCDFEDRYDSDGNTISSETREKLRRERIGRNKRKDNQKDANREDGGGSRKISRPKRRKPQRPRRKKRHDKYLDRIMALEKKLETDSSETQAFDPDGESWFAGYLAVADDMSTWCLRHSDRTKRVWSHVVLAIAQLGVGMEVRTKLSEWINDYRYNDGEIEGHVQKMAEVDARIVEWGGSSRFPPTKASFWSDLVDVSESLVYGMDRHIHLRRDVYGIYSDKESILPNDAREEIARSIRLLDATIRESKPNLRLLWRITHFGKQNKRKKEHPKRDG